MSDSTRKDRPPKSDLLWQTDITPPLGSVISTIEIGHEVLVEPDEPSRPWLVAGSSERVVKLYSRQWLERHPDHLGRVRREAETALALTGVEGVVPATAVEETSEWITLEMQRYSWALSEHLAARDLDHSIRRHGHVYVEWIAQIAETLGDLHGRGVLHRDIKPANLLWDERADRLLICDFSVVAVPGSDLTRSGTVVGTDRYIAPECWAGAPASPASDQYSLGLVAQDCLSGPGSPTTPNAIADVLRKATSADPRDRYLGADGIVRFARALRRALHAEAPATIADRLRSASPATRFAWAPAAAASLWVWTELVVDRDPDQPLGATIVYPILAAVVGFTVARFLNQPRARRTTSGAKVLNQWWPPWLLVVAYATASPGEEHGWTFLPYIAIPVAFAMVGAYPENAGYWVVRLFERIEWLRPALRRLASAGLLATVVIWILTPGALQRLAPKRETASVPAAYQAIRQARALQQDISAGNWRQACSRIDPRRNLTDCASRLQQLPASIGASASRSTTLDLSRLGSIGGDDAFAIRLGTPERSIGVLRDSRSGTYRVVLADGDPAPPTAIEGRPSTLYLVTTSRHGPVITDVARCPAPDSQSRSPRRCRPIIGRSS